MNKQLVDFYRGQGTDTAGRKIDDVWGFDHQSLEGVHDYIQWLFPSAKASQFNPDAPLLDAETIALFTGDDDLKARLAKSFALMLDFYGLERSTADGAVVIGKAANYADRQATWQDAPAGYINHNLLRLTRIIEALKALGLDADGAALYQCLAEIQPEVPEKIPAKTAHFWRLAAGVA